MLSWGGRALCELPQQEIIANENDCSKTHPQINIAEELLKAPRSCNTVSFAKIHNNEIDEFEKIKWKIFKDHFKHFYFLLRRWFDIISKVFEKLKQYFLTKNSDFNHIETCEMSSCCIRCMAWHPHVFKLAIACADDVIRVYNKTGKEKPTMKHKSQKSIACLAWRPFAIDEIAVGCEAGIIFWYGDKPEDCMLYMEVLKYQNHFPITALEWREDGLMLASISKNDSSILLWNVDTGKCITLKRVQPKCCFLSWVPQQTSELFCATVDRIFGLWNINQIYDFQGWGLDSGCIQSAAWSPCGRILLFATNNVTKLYRFQQIENSPFLNAQKQWEAMSVANLMPICVGSTVIGVLAQSIVWDPRGKFVAVTFKQTNCIAVFLTKINGENFFIDPHGYISGKDDLFPVAVCFQSLNKSNENVILTIGWSNGIVQFCLLH